MMTKAAARADQPGHRSGYRLPRKMVMMII